VPTVCLATSAVNDPGALLSLVVDYYRYRYNEPCDGCVAISDAVLPGAKAVFLSDMDHYGPAWQGFPSNDSYDKTAMCLALIWLGLGEEMPVEPEDASNIGRA
jgi:hypothetical protein